MIYKKRINKKIFLFIFFLICALGCFVYSNVFFHHKKKPVAYFFVWDPVAIWNDPALNGLSHFLSTLDYQIFTKPFEKLEKNDLNFVAWKDFSLPPIEDKEQSYLWLLESPISIKLFEVETYKKHFNKIFTWHKPSSDGNQVIWVPIPYPRYNYIGKYKQIDFKSKEYLVSQVAKFGYGHNYHLRAESILWFLKNHPEDFRFFGPDWGYFYSVLPENLKPVFNKKYGGFVEDKFAEISKAKFVLTYENERYEDYVSEKIYDVMVAGSVPIYSGAPNITDYVPQACFIDFYAYKSHEELYDFLVKMTEQEYKKYLSCAREFLKSAPQQKNHPDNVTNEILKNIDFKRLLEARQIIN